MQRSRRSNPYPFTWEIPVAVAAAVLLLGVLGAQAGRSLANLLAGNGWVFVDRANLFATLAPVLHGQAGAGLPGLAQPAGPGLMWTCVGAVELLVVIGVAAGVKAGLDRWGPHRLQGMATPAEAEALLGPTRLRKHAKVIRPDLYGPAKGRAW
jgi:hypothetical protein